MSTTASKIYPCIDELGRVREVQTKDEMFVNRPRKRARTVGKKTTDLGEQLETFKQEQLRFIQAWDSRDGFPSQMVELLVYVSVDFLKHEKDRENLIKAKIALEAPWFWSYGERHE